MLGESSHFMIEVFWSAVESSIQNETPGAGPGYCGEPPLRPRTAAEATELDCLTRSSVRAIAALRNSRQAVVRFFGNSGALARMRSAWASSLLSAASSV